ncbi:MULTISPECIES: phospho-sugar mutase [unclassified Enterococcus]|uniref:phospho-sugar mutase n=1 Tax=unclassified Enterococcus TaxID=2608891 RepID=UPI001A91B2DA|nr:MULTISPECIES: phospho-sugar mutase [unclassified Enterococcus]MBO0461836.1 phospho-sugar mutase [Enterococcus sp. DIV1298c]MBO1300739.1 phospho-sugar mutase [Enterococcus sp. DIV1271a]
MTWQQKYQEWLNEPSLDEAMKEQLAALSDPLEIEDRFYQYLTFGTGGMRGELGVGTNRLNVYTIKRVAFGLATYILETNAANQGVVIAFDNRHGSKEFAEWTARVLASQGIKVYLSDCLRPTPQLSFLVRHYQAYAGVMITASHNPKQYNGFKVYGPDGGQITLETAERLTELLENGPNELVIEADSLAVYREDQLIQLFGEEVDTLYLEQLTAVIQSKEKIQRFGSQLNLIYTPLHGAGNRLMQKAFKQIGFSNLQIIKEQALPDPDFSTVASPNPEDKEAFALALTEAKKQDAQLILATDPDADRLGVVVLKDGEPYFLTGNQIGALLLDYLIRMKQQNQESLVNYFIAKTIVTSELGSKIAQAHGIETRNTLTGFKFIGEQIQQSEEQHGKEFLFGYEESYGYLIAPFVRDKDAIQAAVLLAEAALDQQLLGQDLIDRLNVLYEEYGYYQEYLETQVFSGKDGISQMNRRLDRLRAQSFSHLGEFKLACTEDYARSLRTTPDQQSTLIELPTSNVLKYIFTDGSWLCLRPSGTEPKFKIYYSVKDTNQASAQAKLLRLQKGFQQLVDIL